MINMNLNAKIEWDWLGNEEIDISPEPKNLPKFIQIEPTNRCNFNCYMCARNNLSFNETNISKSRFSNIIDNFDNANKVIIQGLGEPFLNNEIYRLIDEARKKDKKTLIISNGYFFTHKNYLSKLKKSGLDELIVSVDSIHKKNYQKFRNKSFFSTLINGLRNAREFNNSGIKLGISFVVTTLNIDEIIDIINFAIENSIPNILFQELQFHHDYRLKDKNASFKEPKKTQKLFDIAMEMAKESDISLCINKYQENNKVRSNCIYPFGGTYINCNGEISPCCNIFNIKFGTIKKNNFKDIWYSERFIEFRKNLLSENVPNICKDCIFL